MLKKFGTFALAAMVAVAAFGQTSVMTKSIKKHTLAQAASFESVVAAVDAKVIEDEAALKALDVLEQNGVAAPAKVVKEIEEKAAAEATIEQLVIATGEKVAARPLEAAPVAKFANQSTSGDVTVSTDDKGAITAVTGGTEYLYMRDGSALCSYVSNSSIKYSYQGGTVTVVKDGNDWYIKDPVSNVTSGLWVKGTVADDTLTVAAGQLIYESTSYDMVFKMGARESSSWVAAAGDIKYVVNETANTLTLVGATATVSGTSITFDGGIAGGFWSDDDSFSGYGEFNTKLTYDPSYVPASTELVELPESATVLTYYYTANKVTSSATTMLKGTTGVAFVGDDVYAQICFDFPTAWIKGTKDAEGNVVFPKLQYVGAYSTSYPSVWMVGTNGSAMDDFTMTFNATDSILTATCALYETISEFKISYVGQYQNIVLNAHAPVVPTYDVPYTNAIVSADDFDLFTVIDVNADSKTWTYGTSCAKFTYHGTNTGDDWLISPGLKLKTGSPYLLSYDLKTGSYPEKYEIKMGTAATAEAMTITLAEVVELKNTTYTTYGAGVTVPADGVYYIGIHAVSDPDQGWIYLQNFKVADGSMPAAVDSLTLTDAGKLSFIMPTTNAAGQELAAEGLTYTYVLNGESHADNAATPGQKVVLDVTLKNGLNKVTVVAVSPKGASANAEASAYVDAALEVPCSFAFNSTDDVVPFTVIDNNADNSTWTFNATAKAMAYKYHASNKADDWLIAPAVKMTAGRTYILKYSAKGGTTYPEKMEVKIGKGITAAAMTQTIEEEHVVGSDPAELVELEFQVAETGEYNIGFHAVSDPDEYYLYLYSFSLEAGALPEAPAAVSDLTVTPGAQGALEATVSFKAPTKNMAGNDVAALTKIVVSREDSIVKTFEAPAAGAELSFTDTNLANGTHTWTVVAYNAYDFGGKAKASAFVGQDVPARADAELVDMKTAIRIQWEAVTEGKNGGYIDPAGVSYEIWTLEETWLGYSLGDSLGCTTDTHFDIANNNDEGEQGFAQYAMCVKNAVGNSGYYITNGLVIGEPDEVPYFESFAGGSVTHFIWTSTEAGDGEWGLTKQMDADNDGGAAAFSADAVGDISSIVTGKITLAGVTNPQLKFQAIANGVTLKVLASKRDGTVTELAAPTVSDTAWTALQVDLNAYKAEDYLMIYFQATATDEEGVLLIDDIQVRDVLDHNLVLGLTAPKKVAKGDTIKVTVKVTNEGSNAATGYKVKMNDQAVTESESLASFASKEYNFTIPTTIFDEEDVVEISAEVEYALELKAADNADEAEVTLTESKAAKVLNLKAANTADGVKLTWNSADEAAANGVKAAEEVEDFEGFENNQASPYTQNPDPENQTYFTNWNKVGELGEWTTYDLDGGAVYGWESGSNFPYMADAMGWCVMDVVEDFTSDVSDMAHSGTKALFCMNIAPATGGAQHNDDWLISPELDGTAQTISFWVSEITNQYGDEQYEVLYSTTDKEVASFTKIGDTRSVTAAEFTEVSVELPAGAKYFAIRCVSADIFGMIIDDITFSPNRAPAVPTGFNVYKNKSKVATVTEHEYLDTVNEAASYAVTALYDAVESAPVSVDYDPATGITTISSEKAFNVYSADGRLVRKNVTSVSDLEAGIYVINNQKVTVK